MTQARKHIVSIDHAGTYHCVSRCVRRSWLCGWDSYLQKSFEHRKPWVERKIAELAEVFACSVKQPGTRIQQPETRIPVRFALQAYTTNTGSKTAAHERNCRDDPSPQTHRQHQSRWNLPLRFALRAPILALRLG